MRAGAVALACLLRLASPAQADEAATPRQPATAQPLPPPSVRPWVDPGSAEPIAQGQPGEKDKLPVPASARIDTVAPREPARPHAEGSSHEAQTREGQSRESQRLRHQCLNAVETRQTVAAHRLTEPFRALRAGRQQGEALRAKLCRWKQDQFVYEVFVLRRDGRIVRVYMNAQNGQAVGALEDH